MKEYTNMDLIKKAKSVAAAHKTTDDVKIGKVGCALLTDKNHLFLGVSISAACGIGFCAEHSAIASMTTDKEYRIKKIVSITDDGVILPACGRCRELMYQINYANLDTEIIIDEHDSVKLGDLLPNPWQKVYYKKK
jgi:cytidine deaminase